MRWPWGHRLARFVRRRKDELEAAFGRGGYEVIDCGSERCRVAGDFAELTIARDRRDRWLVSSIRFRALDEDIPAYMLARFLGRDEPASRRGSLTGAQVAEALRAVAPILADFRAHPEKVEQAALCFRRACEEYTRRYRDIAGNRPP